MGPPTRACSLTPPGTAGIAVIQISGCDALRILRRLFRSKQFPSSHDPEANRLYYGQIVAEEQVIDDAVVWCALRQGDWLIEIQCHGGLRVVERVLHAAAALGADIRTQADAPADDVIADAPTLDRESYQAAGRAQTLAVAKWALGQRQALREYIEETIDHLRQGATHPARAMLEVLMARNKAADLLLRGARIALIGPSNAGKSTLANTLIRKEASIVSAAAGTTRDWVAHPASLAGVPVTVTDTAGLREAHDPIERESVVRAMGQAQAADLVLLVLDRSRPLPTRIWAGLAPTGLTASVVAANKCDLPRAWTAEALAGQIHRPGTPVIEVSALKNSGIEDLEAEILEALGLGPWHRSWPALWTDRQRSLTHQAWKRLSDDPPAARSKLQNLIS